MVVVHFLPCGANTRMESGAGSGSSKLADSGIVLRMAQNVFQV